MVAVYYSELLVPTYQTAQCNAPEDHGMNLRKQEKYIISCIPAQQNKIAYANNLFGAEGIGVYFSCSHFKSVEISCR